MVTNQSNPYAAPRAQLGDDAAMAGQFIAAGINRAAAQGWRWLHAGFVLFRQQPGTAILITIVFLAIQLAVAALQTGLAMMHPALSVIASLASLAITPLLVGGWMVGCRALDEGGALRVGHLFAALDTHTKPLLALAGWVLVASLGIALVIGATIAVIGFAAFSGDTGLSARGLGAGIGITIAGLLVVAVSMFVYSLVWFAPALIVLHDFSALDAMKASAQGCLKNIVPLLVYGLCSIGLAIAATIPFMLGWLVFAPVLVGSIYAAYRDIYFR